MGLYKATKSPPRKDEGVLKKETTFIFSLIGMIDSKRIKKKKRERRSSCCEIQIGAFEKSQGAAEID